MFEQQEYLYGVMAARQYTSISLPHENKRTSMRLSIVTTYRFKIRTIRIEDGLASFSLAT